MAQELLLEKLEGLASKAKSIEGEKAEAVARIQELETEVGELKELISLADSKVDEILEVGGAPHVSRKQVSSVPLASKGFEELIRPSASELDGLKKRFPHAFTPD
jgi:hypothetical protein